jgi:hypothetical protein
MNIKIIPDPHAGPHRTGELTGVSFPEICTVLGFPPNVDDDPNKVKYSWGFTIDGENFGIWDYKGGWQYNEWSTYGNKAVLRELFGSEYVS